METGRVFNIMTLASVTVLCLFAMPIRAEQTLSFDGDGGFQKSFSLSGGEYKLFLTAKHPLRAYETPSKFCSFGGALEPVTATAERIPLGTAVKLSLDDDSPWKVDHLVTLPAGQYKLWISLQTDCEWSFSLAANAGVESGASVVSARATHCCLGPVRMITMDGLDSPNQDQTYPTTVSLGEVSVFRAPFKKADPSSQVVGFLLIKQGEKTIRMELLGVDEDPISHFDEFHKLVQWDKNETQYLGRITVEFVTTMGRSSAEFTVTR